MKGSRQYWNKVEIQLAGIKSGDEFWIDNECLAIVKKQTKSLKMKAKMKGKKKIRV